MPASGATSLLDGIAATVLGRQPDQARAMVLVFSDGLDNRSWLSLEPVLAVVRESDAVVYALAFRVPDPSASIVSVPAASRPDERLLGRLAGATGGRLVVARDSARFEPAFTGILREMRARYLLTYRPRAVAGAGWHTLTVRLKGRAGQVEARAGYLVREASQPPEPHEPETAAALGELPVFGQGFRQCALEEVRDGQDAGSFAQVVPLKPPALDADNGRDIAPLPVRDLASEAIPAELLEQDVFGRMHVQATAFTQVDGQATGDLAPVEGVPPATNRSTLSWVA